MWKTVAINYVEVYLLYMGERPSMVDCTMHAATHRGVIDLLKSPLSVSMLQSINFRSLCKLFMYGALLKRLIEQYMYYAIVTSFVLS